MCESNATEAQINSAPSLAHLFCPHIALDPPEPYSASGLPPQSNEKICANRKVYFISDSLKIGHRNSRRTIGLCEQWSSLLESPMISYHDQSLHMLKAFWSS